MDSCSSVLEVWKPTYRNRMCSSLPSSTCSDVKLIAGNKSWWEYLQHKTKIIDEDNFFHGASVKHLSTDYWIHEGFLCHLQIIHLLKSCGCKVSGIQVLELGVAKNSSAIHPHYQSYNFSPVLWPRFSIVDAFSI